MEDLTLCWKKIISETAGSRKMGSKPGLEKLLVFSLITNTTQNF